jgi:nucleotide-binding universal stress UspA family protein
MGTPDEMNRPIRVGVDFSAHSTLALEHAVAAARRLGAPIELIHANEAFRDQLAGERRPEELVAFADELEADAHNRLELLRSRCEEAGVEVTARIIRAAAVDALCADEPCRLVAVGATGRSGLDRFLIGSTTTKVIRACRAPILVTRPGRTAYQRVLVATDFAEPAARALETALALSEPGARVDLLHAWRLPTIFTGYLPAKEHEELIGRLAEEVLATAETQARALMDRSGDHRLELITAQGDAASEIVDRSAGYDLVAVGSRGRSTLRRLFAGSVAERTVAHAACSVLVVH